MGFSLDEQTITDLGIFTTIGNPKSIYDIFNYCQSHGGKETLKKVMSKPLSDLETLNDRKDTIAFFHSNPQLLDELVIDKNTLDFIDHYLSFDYPVRKPGKIRAIEDALVYKMKPNNNYYIKERGVSYSIFLINTLNAFFQKISLSEKATPFLIEAAQTIKSYFEQKEYKPFASIKPFDKVKAVELAKFDYMFRYTHKYQLRYFLDLIYTLDMFFSVAYAAKRNNFCYPELFPSDEYVFEATNLYHPFIQNPVANNVIMDRKQNMLFVSGPNMSGKSTFLKAVGISAYLAHIGFPVPATTVKISLLSGIYSTINLKDSLHDNFSHFYAEVKRIKDISLQLAKQSNMLIIFDELFRGTNVKDAYDCSLAVISAFAETENSFYVISTHILEITEKLKQKNIQYIYLETLNNEGIPRYTYKIMSGISDERLGLYILNKEKVVDIIKNISNEFS